MLRLTFLLGLFILTSCATQIGQTPQEKKADLFFQRGTSNLLKNSYTNALKDLIQAAKLAPKRSDIRNNLGMAFYFKKDVSKAKQNIKRALELDRNNTDARFNLASIYMEQGEYDLAKRQYAIVSKDLTFDKQFKTYYNLGLMMIKLGDNNKALEYFQKSVEENSAFCASHFQIGLFNYRKSNFRSALESFKNATNGVCTNSASSHYYQGITMIELGLKIRAKKQLEYVIEKFGNTKYGTLAQIKISRLKAMKEDPYKNAGRFFGNRKSSPRF